MRALCGLGAALMLAACRAPESAPIPVVGGADYLAGRWRGSYENTALQRGGSIEFTLVAGEDHAHGDVVMIPANHSIAIRPAPRPELREGSPLATVLTINFVRAAGDSVLGTITPYRDPECDCTAITTFTGYVAGNVIRGTFVTRRPGGAIAGTWSVQRD